jgi:hypothetical protein
LSPQIHVISVFLRVCFLFQEYINSRRLRIFLCCSLDFISREYRFTRDYNCFFYLFSKQIIILSIANFCFSFQIIKLANWIYSLKNLILIKTMISKNTNANNKELFILIYDFFVFFSVNRIYI